MGVSTGPALSRPALEIEGRAEGALSDDGQILGTYVHGVFDEPAACRALLAWAGLAAPAAIDFASLREASLNRLADTLQQHLQIDRMFVKPG